MFQTASPDGVCRLKVAQVETILGSLLTEKVKYFT